MDVSGEGKVRAGHEWWTKNNILNGNLSPISVTVFMCWVQIIGELELLCAQKGSSAVLNVWF